MQAREQDELLVGILASVIANSGFNRPKSPAQPADFGLGPRARSRSSKITALSDEEIANRWRVYFRAAAGASPGG